MKLLELWQPVLPVTPA
ncbi:hypothetical protein HaLaN_06844, partial [Haematococcus lacustris]